jgi:hypothetical protein
MSESDDLRPKPLTYDEAREDFEKLLDFRRAAESEEPPCSGKENEAIEIGAKLFRNLLDWPARRIGLLLPPEDFRALDRAFVRFAMAFAIETGIPILQPELRKEASRGIRALNGGQVEPLLAPNCLGRRGVAPYQAAEAEFALLKWIRWRHGLGWKVGDAEMDVAKAIGQTTQVIANWKRELCKVYGRFSVLLALCFAEQVGQYEATGQSWADYPCGRSWFDTMIADIAKTLDRDLIVLAKQRRTAIAKRGVPKTKSGSLC